MVKYLAHGLQLSYRLVTQTPAIQYFETLYQTFLSFLQLRQKLLNSIAFIDPRPYAVYAAIRPIQIPVRVGKAPHMARLVHVATCTELCSSFASDRGDQGVCRSV